MASIISIESVKDNNMLILQLQDLIRIFAINKNKSPSEIAFAKDVPENEIGKILKSLQRWLKKRRQRCLVFSLRLQIISYHILKYTVSCNVPSCTFFINHVKNRTTDIDNTFQKHTPSFFVLSIFQIYF